MLGRVGEAVEVLDDAVKGDRLLCLLEAEGGADLELDLEDEAGAAESAEGGEEEVRVLETRAADAGAVCEEEDEGEHVGGDDLEVHTGAVGGGGDDTGQGLVGNRAEIDHGKVVGGEGGMEGTQGDAALGKDMTFLWVDLQTPKERGWVVSEREQQGVVRPGKATRVSA